MKAVLQCGTATGTADDSWSIERESGSSGASQGEPVDLLHGGCWLNARNPKAFFGGREKGSSRTEDVVVRAAPG